MGKPKVRPPSQVDSLAFPVFGLTWHGTPSSPKRDGSSVVAYCGGGGSSKTGVFNKIVVTVTADDPAAGDGGGAPGESLPSGPTFVSRQLEISTGEALCFGVHAFRPHDDNLGMVRLLACLGDEVLLYGIPLIELQTEPEGSEGDGEEKAILLGKTHVGKGYGANVTAYSSHFSEGKLSHFVAVGCENGAVIVYSLNQNGGDPTFEFVKVAECQGHTKAVCAVNFHPRGHQLLSSAKDGTARVFNVQDGSELGVLKCEVHDPNGPPPVQPAAGTMKTKDPRMMKRPPQILVRGCAYGDLEGKVIYTVASGKRGPAYLTKWKTLVPLNKAMPGAPPTSSAGGPPSQKQPLSFRQRYRIQCSPVPVSAASLSSDGSVLALGSVEGSISLYNLETQSVMKQFSEVHDLPVTCIASRPVPNVLMLPGELEGGVNFDVFSASADNRFGKWTLQKKSRISRPRQSSSSRGRRRNVVEQYLWALLRIPLMILLLLTIVAIRDTIDVCGEEFGLSALVIEPGKAGHCLYREVLWAEEDRVSFVPE
ncbi:hypothetical protein ACHAWF_016204 [Thalassiosira exigua]